MPSGPHGWRAGGAALPGPPPRTTFLPLDGEEAGRRRIRFVYQRFLAAMVARRQPRAPGQTPVEYAQEVGDLPPPQRAALDALTEVYVVARYALAPPTPGQVAAGEAAWAGLAPALAEEGG